MVCPPYDNIGRKQQNCLYINIIISISTIYCIYVDFIVPLTSSNSTLHPSPPPQKKPQNIRFFANFHRWQLPFHMMTWRWPFFVVGVQHGCTSLNCKGWAIRVKKFSKRYIYLKDPDMSQGMDFPYIPILGMGLRPSILL